MINNQKKLEKINEFINECKRLLELNYKDGEEAYADLEVKLRNFLSTSFDDTARRMDDCFFVVAVGTTYEQTELEKNSKYVKQLKRIKRCLNAYKDEIEMEEGLSKKKPEEKKVDYIEITKLVNKLAEEEFRAFSYVSPSYSNELISTLKEHHRKNINQLCDNHGYRKDILAKYEELSSKALNLAKKDERELSYVSPQNTNKNLLDSLFTHRNELIKDYFRSSESVVMKETKEESEVEGKSYAVFLSHSKQDKDLANKIKKLLIDIDVVSFVAHDDIEEGEIWEPALIDAIKNSKIMVVLGTENIEDSAWVNFETGLGYNTLFPLIFVNLSDKVSYIKNKQGIILDYTNLDKGILKLIYTTLTKLGIAIKKSDEEIIKLKSFKEVKNHIHNHYKPKSPTLPSYPPQKSN